MSDLPRFLNIGSMVRGFNVRKKDARLRQTAYPGMAVASADAIYLAPQVDPRGGKRDRRRLFDVADPLVEEKPLEELPAEVTGHRDWPLTWDEGPVLVVPRRAVRSLRTSLMLGGIELTLRDVRILIFTPVFRRKQLASYLTGVGWEVEGASDEPYRAASDPQGLSAREVQRRKTSRAVLVVGLVVLAVGLGLLVWQWPWVQSALAGPAPITVAALRRLDDPDRLANPWVSFRMGQTRDTGMGLVNTGLLPTILGESRSKYVLVQVEDEWLVAKFPEGYAGEEVVGYLSRWQTPLARESLDNIRAAFPGLPLRPFQLDADYHYRRECFALMVVVAFLVVAGPLLILRSLRVALAGDRAPAGPRSSAG